ncbi:hypothetical protein NC797_16880 [Aquibacillus sp. 3ASR75-11]|uniref:Uncharacterized protein n=1 Tax=Terrihalobacillus insolitus TaxID=2950438 RepID=A0A9X4AQ21_9BACI|nr:hypothetical protein [Terrihalobacillus insolitus]MDC3426173.1 hypothetical protein [Terrihalobacillus insolitus]
MEFIFNLIGSLFEGIGQDQSLNTKKIDDHIEKLKRYPWFKELYENEQYHQKIFTNRHVRRYLQSKGRVRRMIKYEKSRKKFITLLNAQIQPKS